MLHMLIKGQSRNEALIPHGASWDPACVLRLHAHQQLTSKLSLMYTRLFQGSVLRANRVTQINKKNLFPASTNESNLEEERK